MLTVDARGDACPLPVVKAKKAIAELNGAGEVEVLVDNEIAVQNLTKMAQQKGYRSAAEKLAEREYRVLFTVGEPAAEEEEAPVCTPDARTDTVVVIASDKMGEGAEELGKTLLKAFIFSLTQQDKLPKTILLYNGGAHLTCEGSPMLDDLKALEAEGYTAPMEGLTDRIWRQAHQRWFGVPGAPARYYAPFISPPENRVLIKKKMAELDPAANPGAPVIPQLLAKDGALAAWMIGELRKMGYTEVNLNFGCPSGTVTTKGKGAGMLRDLSKLEVFLDEVFSQAEGPISVKTRLGVTSPEEFEAILDLYDRCPICELTIHPRVMRQLYRGEADRAAFAKYLPHCKMPVCYNGDITTPAQLKALEAEFPNLSGIMVGRGIIADPALLRQAVGGAPASKEELRGYLDELYHGYTEAFGMASCAVSRMKAHWHYLIQRFEGSEAFEKQLRKAREGWEYEVVVNQLFTLPLL